MTDGIVAFTEYGDRVDVRDIAGKGNQVRILAKELNNEKSPTRLAHKQSKGEQRGRHLES